MRLKKRKKEGTPRETALALKKEHDRRMKGKNTVLKPHPTLPRTYIETIVKS